MLNPSFRPWHLVAGARRGFGPAVLLAALGAVAAPTPVEHLSLSPPGAFEGAALEPAPPHVVAFWERLVGTWVADNTPYKSDLDPMDAYGIEWKWGLNRKSIVGRLYGIRDGKEIGTFWEFREFWHPGERRVVAMQFGTEGTYGAGPHEIDADGASEMLQVFHDPARTNSTKIGHRAHLKGDVHTTTSFNVDEKGVWTERRTYVWRRQPGAGVALGRAGPGAYGISAAHASCTCCISSTVRCLWRPGG